MCLTHIQNITKTVHTCFYLCICFVFFFERSGSERKILFPSGSQTWIKHWQQTRHLMLGGRQSALDSRQHINTLLLKCWAVFIFCTLLNTLIFLIVTVHVYNKSSRYRLHYSFKCKILNRTCLSLQQCVSTAILNESLYYHMVAWWGLDTAGGMLWDSPSCHTSPALHPHHSKSSSIRECVCPPIAASASWALAWHFWPSPPSPTPQHSGENNKGKFSSKQWQETE